MFVYLDETAMSAGRTAFYYEYAYFNYNSNFVLNLPGIKYPSTEEEMVRRYIYTKDEVIKAYSYNILYNEILTGFFVNKMNGNQGEEFDVNYHIPFKVGKNQEVIDFQFISSSNYYLQLENYFVMGDMESDVIFYAKQIDFSKVYPYYGSPISVLGTLGDGTTYLVCPFNLVSFNNSCEGCDFEQVLLSRLKVSPPRLLF